MAGRMLEEGLVRQGGGLEEEDRRVLEEGGVRVEVNLGRY